MYDVIVVGAGVMGSATAYQLARAGVKVLLLEQFALGHARGSSHGHSRIIRRSYEERDYVRLTEAAYRAWNELGADVGEQLITRSGGLDLGHPTRSNVFSCCEAMRAEDVPFEVLNAAALRERFPQFEIDEDNVGVYQADAGILDASHCVALLQQQAQRYGADIRAEQTVEQVAPDGDGVMVRVGTTTHRAGRAVVTAGSYLGPLVEQLGLHLPITVTREQVMFFRPLQPEAFAVGRFPLFIHYGDSTGEPHSDVKNSFYGFPMFGLDGVKVGHHHGGTAIDPLRDAGAVEDAPVGIVHDYLRKTIPAAAGEVMLAETCRYTTTSDTDFIVDRHPEYPQIVIGSPCSGHGFKFGAVMGQLLADLATRGQTTHDISRFALSRFTS